MDWVLPTYSRYRDIIPDFETFLEALKRPVPVHVRVNTLKTNPPELEARLRALGATVSPEPLNPLVWRISGLSSIGRQLEYLLGFYHPQGLTSTLPGLELDPRPGEFVLDMCAAPGGKTSQLAAQMGNDGLILANDVSLARVATLKTNLERLGVLNTITRVGPAQAIPKKYTFDRILLDAPCSGLGAWRQGLAAPMGRFPERILRVSRLQRELILRAFDLLKPGGVLVYSTCTFAPEENEAVVDWLLQRRPSAEILPLTTPAGREGLREWSGSHFDPQLERTRRFYPHDVDSWGFFIAKIGKC
ncbi:MAG: RsmB/NOP family class I SAM-dependent RNA methyltransferase [candidate division KSB1 bacterium]|nr:RsmB/NOP family class I SAM-dependent RNA methyltransferase [candidate division KSB1 bacterium]